MKTRSKAEIESIKSAVKAMHAFIKAKLHKNKSFDVQNIPDVIHRAEVYMFIDGGELKYEVESEKHIGTSPLGKKIVKEYNFENWFEIAISETKEFRDLEKEFTRLFEHLSKVSGIDKYTLSELLSNNLSQTELETNILNIATTQVKLNKRYVALIREDGSVKVGCQTFAKSEVQGFIKAWTEATQSNVSSRQ